MQVQRAGLTHETSCLLLPHAPTCTGPAAEPALGSCMQDMLSAAMPFWCNAIPPSPSRLRTLLHGLSWQCSAQDSQTSCLVCQFCTLAAARQALRQSLQHGQRPAGSAVCCNATAPSHAELGPPSQTAAAAWLVVAVQCAGLTDKTSCLPLLHACSRTTAFAAESPAWAASCRVCRMLQCYCAKPCRAWASLSDCCCSMACRGSAVRRTHGQDVLSATPARLQPHDSLCGRVSSVGSFMQGLPYVAMLLRQAMPSLGLPLRLLLQHGLSWQCSAQDSRTRRLVCHSCTLAAARQPLRQSLQRGQLHAGSAVCCNATAQSQARTSDAGLLMQIDCAGIADKSADLLVLHLFICTRALQQRLHLQEERLEQHICRTLPSGTQNMQDDRPAAT